MGSLSAAQFHYTLRTDISLTKCSSDHRPGKEQLLLANIRKNTITEICDGTEGNRDGNIRLCQLNNPYSVRVVNQSMWGSGKLYEDFLWQLSASSFHQPQKFQVKPGLYHLLMPCENYPLFDYFNRWITSSDIYSVICAQFYSKYKAYCRNEQQTLLVVISVLQASVNP